MNITYMFFVISERAVQFLHDLFLHCWGKLVSNHSARIITDIIFDKVDAIECDPTNPYEFLEEVMVLHQWRNKNFQRIPIYIYEESSASMLYEGKTIYVSKSCSFSDVFFLQAMKPEYEWWKRIVIGNKTGEPVRGYQLYQLRDQEFSASFSLSKPIKVWAKGSTITTSSSFRIKPFKFQN